MNAMKSELSTTYYSSSNVEYIQKTIADSVKSATGYQIGRQDDMDLYNLMRKVYTDYMVNDSENVLPQVNEMNKVVVSMATKTISNGIVENLIYLRDISTLPVPPQTPKNTSTYGLKLSRF
jgi:hypothetical protein